MLRDGGEMAGESAQEQYERLRRKRQMARRDPRAVRIVVLALVLGVAAAIATEAAFGAWWLGALPIALTGAGKLGPWQREVAWRRGAEGERVVGRALDALTTSGARVLHDRRIPGSRANIDHIIVAPTGVFTVDAKHYKGRLRVLRRGTELRIDGRDRSKLVGQALRQAEVVRAVLARDGSAPPVRSALCFVGVEWPLLFAPTVAGGVELLSPRRVSRLLDGRVVLGPAEVERLAGILDLDLVPASGGKRRPDATGASHRRTAAAAAPVPTAAAVPVQRVADRPTIRCSCGADLVMRRRRRDGAPFWGCSTFPACRRTRAAT